MKRILPFCHHRLCAGSCLTDGSVSPARVLGKPCAFTTDSRCVACRNRRESGRTRRRTGYTHSVIRRRLPLSRSLATSSVHRVACFIRFLKVWKPNTARQTCASSSAEFPLVPTHVHALAAARAAEAAGLQGRFWEMHDLIYEHQKDWHGAFDVRPIFEGYAKTIGLDVAQFTRDNATEVVERRIFLDGKRAHSLGVQGTPTVFLNGKEVPFESLAPDKLKALINNELAAHR